MSSVVGYILAKRSILCKIANRGKHKRLIGIFIFRNNILGFDIQDTDLFVHHVPQIVECRGFW